MDYVVLIAASFAAGYLLEKWIGHAKKALAVVAGLLPLLPFIHQNAPWLIEDLFEPPECKGINYSTACRQALAERPQADPPSFWLIGALVVGPALGGVAAESVAPPRRASSAGRPSPVVRPLDRRPAPLALPRRDGNAEYLTVSEASEAPRGEPVVCPWCKCLTPPRPWCIRCMGQLGGGPPIDQALARSLSEARAVRSYSRVRQGVLTFGPVGRVGWSVLPVLFSFIAVRNVYRSTGETVIAFYVVMAFPILAISAYGLAQIWRRDRVD